MAPKKKNNQKKGQNNQQEDDFDLDAFLEAEGMNNAAPAEEKAPVKEDAQPIKIEEFANVDDAADAFLNSLGGSTPASGGGKKKNKKKKNSARMNAVETTTVATLSKTVTRKNATTSIYSVWKTLIMMTSSAWWKQLPLISAPRPCLKASNPKP